MFQTKFLKFQTSFYKIDDAMKAGFLGKRIISKFGMQFEVFKRIELAPEAGFTGFRMGRLEIFRIFYKVNGRRSKHFLDKNSGNYNNIPGQEAFIILDNIRKKKTLWSNSWFCNPRFREMESSIWNSFKNEFSRWWSFDGLNKAIDLAEKEYDGLVMEIKVLIFCWG